jgi:hypothetical protein
MTSPQPSLPSGLSLEHRRLLEAAYTLVPAAEQARVATYLDPRLVPDRAQPSHLAGLRRIAETAQSGIGPANIAGLLRVLASEPRDVASACEEVLAAWNPQKVSEMAVLPSQDQRLLIRALGDRASPLLSTLPDQLRAVEADILSLTFLARVSVMDRIGLRRRLLEWEGRDVVALVQALSRRSPSDQERAVSALLSIPASSFSSFSRDFEAFVDAEEISREATQEAARDRAFWVAACEWLPISVIEPLINSELFRHLRHSPTSGQRDFFLAFNGAPERAQKNLLYALENEPSDQQLAIISALTTQPLDRQEAIMARLETTSAPRGVLHDLVRSDEASRATLAASLPHVSMAPPPGRTAILPISDPALFAHYRRLLSAISPPIAEIDPATRTITLTGSIFEFIDALCTGTDVVTASRDLLGRGLSTVEPQAPSHWNRLITQSMTWSNTPSARQMGLYTTAYLLENFGTPEYKSYCSGEGTWTTDGISRLLLLGLANPQIGGYDQRFHPEKQRSLRSRLAAATNDASIIEALSTEGNVVISEFHNQRYARDFLGSGVNLQALADHGYDTLYLEGFLPTDHALIEEFYRTGKMPQALATIIEDLDQWFDGAPKVAVLFKECLRAGVRIVGIDSPMAASRWAAGKTLSMDSFDRTAEMNAYAAQVITGDTGRRGKYIVLVGHAHATLRKERPIIGLSELLGIPAIKLYPPKKDPTAGRPGHKKYGGLGSPGQITARPQFTKHERRPKPPTSAAGTQL